jgi:hypothetical protein
MENREIYQEACHRFGRGFTNVEYIFWLEDELVKARAKNKIAGRKPDRAEE